jgi:hypothetical protein
MNVTSIIVIIVLGLAAVAGFYAYRAYQAENAEARTLNSLPSTVRHVVAQMDASSQASFFNEYERKKRRLSLCYVCWWTCGLHYLYLRKPQFQLVMYLFSWTGIGIVWWFIDLFRMPGLARTANEQVAREALQTLHIGATFAQLSGQTATQFLVGPATHGAPGTTPSSVPTMPPPHAPGTFAGPAGGAPQWAPDPTGRHEHRFWDGAAWTAHVSTASVEAADPI